MAIIKDSDLPLAVALDDADILAIVQSITGVLTSGRTTLVALKEFLVGVKTRQFLTSTTTLTPANTDEECGVNAQAAALAIAAPAGTWQDGDTLVFRLKDSGTTRAITWNAAYVWIGAAYTNTTAGKWAYITAIYNAVDDKWHLMPAQVQS